MDAEIQAIQRNDTWQLIDPPSDCKIIGVKWIFKTKLKESGEIDKFKARLVAKDYTQEKGIDYGDIFAPVARLETIRTVIAIAAEKRWSIYQLDIKSAFLHGEINEDVYLEQPPRYICQGREHQVYKLKKALYGLKQAPRAWYNTRLLKDDKGTEVDSTLYKQLVGSLMYLIATRPDTAYAVSFVSHFMEHPIESHFLATKRILRYLQGTQNLEIFYKAGINEKLFAYTDSDYAGDLEDRKSTSGYAFLLAGGVISWVSKKQPVVSLSITEAEFIAAALCACQCVWLRRVLEHLDQCQFGTTVIFCDNGSTIKLSKNPILHGRSKHIDVRFHFLRNLCNDGVIELNYCSTRNQLANIITKPLKVEDFQCLRSALGMLENTEIR